MQANSREAPEYSSMTFHNLTAYSDRRLSSGHFALVTDCSRPFRDRRLKGWSPGLSHVEYPHITLRCPHTAKIHTLITLSISIPAKPPVLKARKRLPVGFDSYRPLHFSLSGVSLRCRRTRLSLLPRSHSVGGYNRSFDRMRRSTPRSSSYSMVPSVRHRPRC